MTTNYEDQVKLINDLVILNNDRIEGYDLASAETTDLGLRKLFEQYAKQSRDNVIVLASEIGKLGSVAATHTTTSGKFFRAWMEIKTALTAKNEKGVLESCEYGEDVILEAYKDALDSDITLSSDLKEIVVKQKDELETAHDTIKKMRDTVVA